MPMTINVGLSKKIGLPDYGSLGATCHVDFEVDQGLLQHDPEAFQRHVRNAYVACAQAINDELGRHQAGNGKASPATNGAVNGNGHAAPNGNGHATNGNQANGARRNGQPMPVSEKQLNFAKQLAKSIQGLGIRRLEDLAQKLYGKPLAALTTIDGSGLIDTLKSIKAGEVNVEQALGGAA